MIRHNMVDNILNQMINIIILHMVGDIYNAPIILFMFSALTNSSLPIQMGYFSRIGANELAPNFDGTHADYGWCPRGYYCPERTTEPIPCPAGSYGYVQTVSVYMLVSQDSSVGTPSDPII